MSATTNTLPHDWQEGRRLRALELYEAGWKAIRIAEALGVTRGAVSQWLKAARAGGREALRRRPRLGQQPKLTAEQRAPSRSDGPVWGPERWPALQAKPKERSGQSSSSMKRPSTLYPS